MKVITKCIIDIASNSVLYEKSYEYSGPTIECKGSGGSSGKVDFPGYMKDFQEDLLNNTAADTIDVSHSMVDVMNAAFGANPWTSAVAFDPLADITDYENAIGELSTCLSGLSDTTTVSSLVTAINLNWNSIYSQAKTSIGAAPTAVVSDATVSDATASADISIADKSIAGATAPADISVVDASVADATLPTDASSPSTSVADRSVSDVPDITDVVGITDDAINSDASALQTQLTTDLTTNILPRFNRGMQDINAVCSSAFVIGQSVIEGIQQREVARHASQLRVEAAKTNVNVSLDNTKMHLDVNKTNQEKDIRLALANLQKDVNVAERVLNAVVETNRINMEKNTSIYNADLDKNIRVAVANLQKAIDVAKSNLSKSVEIDRMNLDASTRIAVANLQKDVEVASRNLSKSVDITTANLRKNTDIATANLQKNIRIETFNDSLALSYISTYLSGSSQGMRFFFDRMVWEIDWMKAVIEGKRIKIVAKKEQTDENNEISHQDAIWDLGTFQYAGNLLSSIQGASLAHNSRVSNRMESAIGGALSVGTSAAMMATMAGASGTTTGMFGGGGALLGAALALL